MASSGTPQSSSMLLPDASQVRVAIVAASWHRDIVDVLVEGARHELLRMGVTAAHITTLDCPGTFEVPILTAALARSGSVDAVLCFGVVVRGETPHFEYVAGPTADAIQQIAVETEIPCVFGILTTETVEQAWDRAGGQHGHKGIEAATTALHTLGALQLIRNQSVSPSTL